MHPRSIFYLSFGTIIVITLVTIWFDYTILFNKITLFSIKIQEHRKETQLLRARMEYLLFFENEARRVELERERIKTQISFPSGFEFFEFLDQTATRTGNEITIRSQEKPKPAFFYVELTGSFNSLLDFILLLKQTQTTVELNGITTAGVKNPSHIVTNLLLLPILPNL